MFIRAIKFKFSSHYLMIAILISALLLTNMRHAQAGTKDAANFINDLAARVISVVKNHEIDDKSKEKRLNEIFINSVDTKWIGKFAMGRYWRSINANQQEQFLKLYTEYLTGLYVPNFRKYTGNIVTVISAKEVRKNEFVVQTELTDELKTINIRIDYHLMQINPEMEEFVIFDIIAEGVSLITTQRAEINSVMAKNNFDFLMNLLREKTTVIVK